MSRLLIISVILSAATVVRADWTYNPNTGHWYQLTSPDLTWTQAEQEAIAVGGHLVAIGSADENDWVRDHFGSASSFVLWIGLYQLPGSQEPGEGWVWSNNEPVVYTNWFPGNPNNGGFPGANPENFGHMYGSGNQKPAGSWNDIDVGPAKHVGPGVIERDVDPTIIPTVSGWGILVTALLILAIAKAVTGHYRQTPLPDAAM